MAEVFEATCRRHGTVAVKRILPGLAEDADFAAMFWDEARITSRLDHPNVVRVLDYGREHSELFMTLEFVDGPSVARLLRKAARDHVELPIGVAGSLVVQLLDALSYVHSALGDDGRPLELVHRDVSPGNLLVASSGVAKLGDFGIVRSEALVRRTQPGELKGKMGYMSPEQALGGVVDQRSDLFAAGIILAELLLLRPLFLGKNELQTLNRTVNVDLSTWHRFNGSVPLPLRSVVERALAADPSVRFQSAGEMRQALVGVLGRLRMDTSESLVREQLVRLELIEKQVGTDISGERRVLDGTRDGLVGADTGILGIGSRELDTEPAPAEAPELRLSVLPHVEGGVAAAERTIWHVGFDRRSLPAQLFMAMRRARDGVVELSNEAHSCRIELRSGAIFAVTDSSGAHPLGRLLLEAGVIDKPELMRAIGESRRAGVRLGEYLVAQRRLRESTLLRLLREQTSQRLAAWFSGRGGALSVIVRESRSNPRNTLVDSEVAPESIAQLVLALRRALDAVALEFLLAPSLDAVVLPVRGAESPETLGLTGPEARILDLTLEGGAFEGRSVRAVITAAVDERLARPVEAAFALFVGLAAGVLHAPGVIRG